MKKYRGYYIDGSIFNSTTEIDEAIKHRAVESYKRAVWLFVKNHNMEASIYADQRAEFLVDQCGMTWEEVEEIEIEAMRAA